MADDIVLAVPEVLSAVYVVPTSRPPEDAAADAEKVAGALGEPLSGLVRGMLSGPLLGVEVRPAADLPAVPDEALALTGAGESARALLREASHAVVVRGVYRPGWPPAHEWGAAAVAGGIAARLDVPVLDVTVPRLLTAQQALDALPTARRAFAAADWLHVAHAATADGLQVATKGLSRFGLPELVTHGVPEPLAGPWASVLTGLAQALLRVFTEALGDGEPPPFVSLPAVVTLEETDVVRAHGAGTEAGAGSVRFGLRLDPATDPDADAFLVVGPPADPSAAPATVADFAVAVCATLFGAGGAAEAVDPADMALAAAVAQARSTLGDVRQRFVDGGFEAGTRLVVKHGLVGADGSAEYVWAYVTGWQSPDEVDGRCGCDAATDEAYRVGRPVRLLADDVVDWAVWADGRGVVEGGFTDAVLSADG